MPESTPRSVIDAIANSTGWQVTSHGDAATIYQRAGDIIAVLWQADGDLLAATIHGYYGARLAVRPVTQDQTASVGVICGWLRYSATPLVESDAPVIVLDADDSETPDEYDDDASVRAGSDAGGDPDVVRDLDAARQAGVL